MYISSGFQAEYACHRHNSDPFPNSLGFNILQPPQVKSKAKRIQLVLVGKAQDECPGSIQLAPKGHEGLGSLVRMQQAHRVSHHAGQQEHLHDGGGAQQVKPPEATHVGDLGTMPGAAGIASFPENAWGLDKNTKIFQQEHHPISMLGDHWISSQSNDAIPMPFLCRSYAIPYNGLVNECSPLEALESRSKAVTPDTTTKSRTPLYRTNPGL